MPEHERSAVRSAHGDPGRGDEREARIPAGVEALA